MLVVSSSYSYVTQQPLNSMQGWCRLSQQADGMMDGVEQSKIRLNDEDVVAGVGLADGNERVMSSMTV